MKKFAIIAFCLIMLAGCTAPSETIQESRAKVEKTLLYAGEIEKIDYISLSYYYVTLVIHFKDGKAIPLQTDKKFLVPAFKGKIMNLYKLDSWTEIYIGGKFFHKDSCALAYVLEYGS